MTVRAISKGRFINRAMAALARRANLDGFVFEQPDEALCVALRWNHKRGPRDYVVLANQDRILAAYRILYLKNDGYRLNWVKRIPAEIAESCRSLPANWEKPWPKPPA